MPIQLTPLLEKAIEYRQNAIYKNITDPMYFIQSLGYPAISLAPFSVDEMRELIDLARTHSYYAGSHIAGEFLDFILDDPDCNGYLALSEHLGIRDYCSFEGRHHKYATLFGRAVDRFFAAYFTGDMNALCDFIETVQDYKYSSNEHTIPLEFNDQLLSGPIIEAIDTILRTSFLPIRSFAEWCDWLAVMMMLDFIYKGKGTGEQRVKYMYNVRSRVMNSPALALHYAGTTDEFEIAHSEFVERLMVSV